jgi:hypothetical protein
VGGSQVKAINRSAIVAKCRWKVGSLLDTGKIADLKHSNRNVNLLSSCFVVHGRFCGCFLSISKLLYFKNFNLKDILTSIHFQHYLQSATFNCPSTHYYYTQHPLSQTYSPQTHSSPCYSMVIPSRTTTTPHCCYIT